MISFSLKKICLLFALIFLAGCSSNTNLSTESVVSTDGTRLAESKNFSEAKKFVRREKVKIKKFFDFQCAFCKQSVATMKALQNDYGKRVEVAYHHYPTKPGSSLLAEASECARDQDKFVDFVDVYFTNYFGQNDIDSIRAVSGQIALDQSLFVTCLESGVKKSVIESDLRLGRKYGLTAVPFFVVGDQQLTGSYPKSAFDKIIRHELTAD